MTTRVRVDVALSIGAVVVLDGDDAHHVLRVLRKRVGAALILVDGAGQAWDAVLSSVTPASAAVRGPRDDAAANPGVALEVWLPLLKGGRTDDLVRQLTEIGVTGIVPTRSARTVVKLTGSKAAQRCERWQAIALEATRQCGRTDVVEVTSIRDIADAASAPGVVFWEAPAQSASGILAAAPHDPLRVLVGPEGGLTLAEVDALRAAGWSVASLGARILRAETAVVAATVLALAALGEAGYGPPSAH